MTDKQIIINGVDVSGCEWFGQIDLDINIICNSNSPKKCSGYCKDNPNCYYKQLAREKKKCEELRKQNKMLSQNNSVQQWCDMYNQKDK